MPHWRVPVFFTGVTRPSGIRENRAEGTLPQTGHQARVSLGPWSGPHLNLLDTWRVSHWVPGAGSYLNLLGTWRVSHWVPGAGSLNLLGTWRVSHWVPGAGPYLNLLGTWSVSHWAPAVCLTWPLDTHTTWVQQCGYIAMVRT